jgi:hypothetical protein
MKTIEQFKAEQAKALAKLEFEHKVGISMPLAPDRVMDCGKRAPWVTYKRASLREAAAIFDAFPHKAIVNMEHTKGTFTSISPPGEYGSGEVQGDYCGYIQVQQYGTSPCVSFEFYARVDGVLVKVIVDIENVDTSGPMSKWRSTKKEEREWRTNKTKKVWYECNDTLVQLSDKRIAFSMGKDIADSYDHYYLFRADDGSDCTEFQSMREKLERISDMFKEPALPVVEPEPVKVTRTGRVATTKMLEFINYLDPRHREVKTPTVAKLTTHALGIHKVEYIVIGTAYGALHTIHGDIRTWKSYSGARRAALKYVGL